MCLPSAGEFQTCPHCQCFFTGHKRKFCSPTCREKNKAKRDWPARERACAHCGVRFIARFRTLLCSPECAKERVKSAQTAKRLAQPLFPCVQCGTQFDRTTVSKTCSPECHKEHARVRQRTYFEKNPPKKYYTPVLLMDRHCFCRKWFSPKNSHQRFCSEECCNKSKHLPVEDKACEHCGKPFSSKMRLKRFCSERCGEKAKKRRERVPLEKNPNFTMEHATCDCGKQLPIPRLKSQRFCSPACSKRIKKREHYRKAPNHQRIRRALSSRLSEVLRRTNGNERASIKVYLACDIREFARYIEAQFTPQMNWENYGVFGWHIDHIIPCSYFNLSLPGHSEACFNWRNLRPLWHEENILRQDRITEEERANIHPELLERCKAIGITV